MAEVSDGWLTIADLAQQRGVSRQSMAERVARLEKLGRLVTRSGAGRTKLVEVAALDRATAETGDAQRALNGSGAKASPTLATEQARRVKVAADIAMLDLAERLGQLTPTAEVREAAQDAVAELKVAFGLALNDVADAAALDLSIEAFRLRPHLRKLENAALAAFVKQTEAYLARLKAKEARHG